VKRRDFIALPLPLRQLAPPNPEPANACRKAEGQLCPHGELLKLNLGGANHPCEVAMAAFAKSWRRE
jgi:hypothetical protein